jgi:hypothetical protein
MNPYIRIWLEELESADDIYAAPSAEFISPITEKLRCSIIGCVNFGNYEPLDSLLNGLNPKMMRSDVMVAVVRTLYPLRSRLSKYNQAVLKVTEELRGRGKDVDRIMRGLQFKEETHV